MPYPGTRINQENVPLNASGMTGSASYYEVKFSDTTKPNGQIWTGVIGSPAAPAHAGPPQRWFVVWLGTANDPVDKGAAKALAESIRPWTPRAACRGTGRRGAGTAGPAAPAPAARPPGAPGPAARRSVTADARTGRRSRSRARLIGYPARPPSADRSKLLHQRTGIPSMTAQQLSWAWPLIAKETPMDVMAATAVPGRSPRRPAVELARLHHHRRDRRLDRRQDRQGRRLRHPDEHRHRRRRRRSSAVSCSVSSVDAAGGRLVVHLLHRAWAR